MCKYSINEIVIDIKTNMTPDAHEKLEDKRTS